MSDSAGTPAAIQKTDWILILGCKVEKGLFARVFRINEEVKSQPTMDLRVKYGPEDRQEKKNARQECGPRREILGHVHAIRFLAARPYQMPERSKTTAQPPVKRIKNGEGSMNQAPIAAAAERPAQT